jgi:hypothetical protein
MSIAEQAEHLITDAMLSVDDEDYQYTLGQLDQFLKDNFSDKQTDDAHNNYIHGYFTR